MPPGDEHPLFAGDAKPATGLTCGGGGVLGGIGVKPPLKPAADCFPGVFNPALTPVGAALLGLSRGQSIAWLTRTGAAKRLTVLDVREPAFA